MNLFQVIILGIFAFFLVFAVLIFSGILPIFNQAPAGVLGEVSIWGTIPEVYMRGSLSTLNTKNEDLYTINYIEKESETFDEDLVEALASGVGPDMILLPQELIVRHQDKIFPIPYTSLPLRTFRDTFIEQGELYLRNNGILALPFSVDPMVMYWNRDIFSSAFVSAPPTEWDEFFTLATKITKKTEAGNISQSTTALGLFDNITHAKDILAMLIIQSGDPIIEVREQRLFVTLGDELGLTPPPAESALRFYTEFSNPVRPMYSWNRSLVDSKDMFAAGDLAVYFGYASEVGDIKAKSPRLNFDAALVPQVRDSERKATFGKMTGVAVLKSSRNIQTAFQAGFELIGKSFIESFAERSGLPPVRRDLLKKSPGGIFGQTFYSSALISKGWPDPKPRVTNNTFRTMIEDVVSGRRTTSDVVVRAKRELIDLLK